MIKIRLGFTPRLALLLLPSVFLFAAAFQQAPPKPKGQSNKPKPAKLASYVIVITISGLSSDLLSKASTEVPTIQALRSKGTHALRFESVFPALKSPNHASLITGVLPAAHGVVSDFPFDERTGRESLDPFQSFPFLPEKKPETIWEAARREKLVTAAIGLPLTANDSVDFDFPATLKGFESERDSDASDSARIAQAVRTIEQNHPNLLVINLASLESTQGKSGVNSQEALQALKQIDAGVKELREAVNRVGVSNETAWIILSDRGMAKIEREFNLNLLLKQKKLLEVDESGNIKSWQAVTQPFGGMAAVFAKAPQDESFVAELENLFVEQYGRPDSPVWRVLKRREIAKMGGDQRASLYLEAAPGWSFSARTTGHLVTKPINRAASGYMPSKSEMNGALILSGKAINPSLQIEYARLTDIAPTVARLLGFELKMARGRVIQEAFKQ